MICKGFSETTFKERNESQLRNLTWSSRRNK